MRDYTSFEQFWPHYLREHADKGTRMLHYIGTALTLVVAAAAILTGKLWMLLLIPVVGYGFAWVSHAFVERNKPATFTYPLWSLLSDYRMFFLAITGRLAPELEKAGVTGPEASAPPRPSATP
ncbi:DUF962 domain-containing protein [Parvularcula maris]|uniref:DUF962 domain-containing protein n=1 Tax=Parvularcula maris TaxID=2965077 RepID=A0A9X2RL49_9PROT|nr:DUF962 domain-containing protein [Parvularcula maris]MCQ8186242.1 DUF962 domain-containing protein [Parvularcula maris]